MYDYGKMRVKTQINTCFFLPNCADKIYIEKNTC